uniref:Protein-glutamine gamma-glutamyltransferase 2 n=1 Tax=Poecilia latipinna TaxID=48699 RepID=A0A3B3U2V2_9TELE
QSALEPNLDLHCHANNVAHNTHEISTSQLIVRRGQPFSITLELDFAFSTSESLKLTVETGATLLTCCSINATSSLQTGCVTLNVTPPADAPVGKYSLSIEWAETAQQHSPTGKTLKKPMLVDSLTRSLCWFADDWVYLPDEKERQEYVMNEQGHIYRGTAHCFSPMFWDFGQFEEEMVDICLKLLDVNPKHKRDPEDDVSARCNPIYVGRVISAMINCYDDMGVLQGCWDGNYHDGVCPTRWTSSVSILQRWFQSDCKAVKYGQCWVFAGVMCTVMRFFGIPCRVVTNFESGHDTNNSLTIDQYFDEYGLKKMGKEDSIWNFHVWVEGWMKRPDLDQDGRYDGWQVLDPTPQERSEGMFCCGPAPVSAIHDGHTNLKYDVPFVFSEVNADVVKWKIKADGSKIKMKYLTDTAKVGQKISTKAVGSTAINDLTNTYKYKEGKDANANSFSQRLGLYQSETIRYMLSYRQESCLRNSQDIKLNLKLSNRGHSVKSLSISVNAQVTNYTATKVKNVLHDSCFQRLNAGQGLSTNHPTDRYDRTYFNHFHPVTLKTSRKFHVAFIILCRNIFTLLARLHHPVMVQVEFKNPLNETLRFCSLTISGSGLFRSDIRELPANTTLTHQIQTTPYRAGLRTVVADFDCSAFRDVKDSCTVYVKP